MKTTRGPLTRLFHCMEGSLQFKIMLLVLMPLVLSSGCLLVLEGVDRYRNNQVQVEQQRTLLVEAREQGVRSSVELASSMIREIQATVSNTQRAQAQAVQLLSSMRFENDNYVFVYEMDGTMLVQPALPESVGTNMLDARDASGREMIRDMAVLAQQGGGFYQYDWPHPVTGNAEPKYSYAEAIDGWGWVVGAGVYVTDIDTTMAAVEAAAMADLKMAFIRLWIIATVINLAITALAIWLARRTVKRIRHTSHHIQAVAAEVASGRGDLTQRLQVTSRDEVGVLAEDFNRFLAHIQSMLSDVRHSALTVYQAADNIAQGSEELATRTDQAAASLQQTSSAMEEITSTVEHNAEHAQTADRMVQDSASVVTQGQTAMEDVERTMADIKASSGQISEIVTLIDSIAFQTNILALNASVEAARAGEHGRGFAVVAQEVRKLAQRSAEAAQEIKTLIATSVEHSQKGSQIVQRAGNTMREILGSVHQVATVIADISAGSKEQSVGVSEVNTAVVQLDGMTQQNAALVEESTATANRMRQQAEQLNTLISGFVLGDATPTVGPLPNNGQPSRSALAGNSPKNDLLLAGDDF
ncbi:methyl-accepting chemotaxis protein [Halomonas sp. M1]|uniref:methyl-accepting chemotaxis protein n=1 Tax=Halomonas sp. M1 TaxID=3035470 RepID=UPI00248671AA|nr:methyl-accepting chemotaxis protein [Halomonas sp. M1]WFE70532.1 methyl-accepting chemotaxis protein [Halomonas sp. M1]